MEMWNLIKMVPKESGQTKRRQGLLSPLLWIFFGYVKSQLTGVIDKRMVKKNNGGRIGLILFVLNKRKLVDLEKIQTFFFHQVGVRRGMGVNLFSVGWLGCMRRRDTVWVGRRSFILSFISGLSSCPKWDEWRFSRVPVPVSTFCWPFYSHVKDRNWLRKTLRKFMIGWKSTLLIVC